MFFLRDQLVSPEMIDQLKSIGSESFAKHPLLEMYATIFLEMNFGWVKIEALA